MFYLSERYYYEQCLHAKRINNWDMIRWILFIQHMEANHCFVVTMCNCCYLGSKIDKFLAFFDENLHLTSFVKRVFLVSLTLSLQFKFKWLCFKSYHLLVVVYFDQWTGAPHTVSWSKSILPKQLFLSLMKEDNKKGRWDGRTV